MVVLTAMRGLTPSQVDFQLEGFALEAPVDLILAVGAFERRHF